MYVRKIKRKCMVRGCKSIETYAISGTREPGNSVVICKDCLIKALDAVNNYHPAEKNKSDGAGAPPLFFHPKKSEPVKTEEPLEEPEETIEYICDKCGKPYKTEAGLKKHAETCGK